MITLFSHPKPFTPEFRKIQHAAIKSWKSLEGCEIVLLGDDEGIAEAARKLQVGHISKIEKNEWGTPLVSDIFANIRQQCHTELACFINTDIILDQSFIQTVKQCSKTFAEEWLLIGRRENIETESLDSFEMSDIQTAPRQFYGNDGIDYFVFPRHTFQFVHPFALGKFVWDQYLVGQVFRRGIPCIDGSKTVTALHLNAPWFFQGQPQRDRQYIHDSEEGIRNRSFEYYQKNIGNGTNHVTFYDETGRFCIRKLFE